MNCPRCQALLPDGAAYCPKCGAMSAPTPAPQTFSGQDTIIRSLVTRATTKLEPGELFANRYEVLTKLGEGGMGIVYAAKDRTSGLELVLKLIHPDLVQGESAVKRLMSEGLTAREIRHPNIVAVYDVSQWERQPYFTMEYVRGRNLRSWLVEQLNRESDVRLDVAVGLIKAILAGLAEAHRMGIVHRDLKPENILLKGDPGAAGSQIKIVDFGIAKAVGTTRTSKTSFGGGGGAGTPHYMAPEQITSSEGIKPSADLYSLSVMLYEMLMDALPQTRWEPVSKLRKDVPTSVDEIIEKGLSVRPRSRYQTAMEYAEALDRAVQVHQVPQVAQVTQVPEVPAHQAPTPAPEPVAKPVPVPVPVPRSEPVPAPPSVPQSPWLDRVRPWGISVAILIGLLALGLGADTVPMFFVQIACLALAAAYVVAWRRGAVSQPSAADREPGVRSVPVLFGIGVAVGGASAFGASFVVSAAALLAVTRIVPIQLLAGTVLSGVGMSFLLRGIVALPVAGFEDYGEASAAVYALAGAAALGAWHGASIVQAWPARRTQVALSVSLVLSAVLLAIPFASSGGDIIDERLFFGVFVAFIVGGMVATCAAIIPVLALALSVLGVHSDLVSMFGATIAGFAAAGGGLRYVRAQRALFWPAVGTMAGLLTGLLMARELGLSYGMQIGGQLLTLTTAVLGMAGAVMIWRRRAEG